jgi:hypothetical protein
MLTHTLAPEQKPPSASLSRLALVIFVLTLVAHLIVIKWIQGALTFPSYEEDESAVITVELETAAMPAPEVKKLIREKAVPAARVSPQQESAPEPAPEPATTPTPLPATNEATSNQTVPVNTSQTATVAPQEAVTSEAIADKTASAAAPIIPDPAPALFDKVSLPPAAELIYKVIAAKEGRKLEGRGSINWQPNGEQYSITGEAGMLFFTVLSYKSTGTINTSGIAPELYVEKRFRKSETNTHFHRERKTISFSASTNSYASKGGEQDRASVIWQIASLGRGDGSKFVPGLVFEILIAGVRSASNWRIYINDKENIELDGKPTEAWHLTLMPAEKSNELQFELWLAPQKEWYPVKLHYADRNDGYLELILTKIVMKH